MDKKTILSFGEILWDILPDNSILGGAPFNFAYRINSLGDRGIIVSKLGKDRLGQEALEHVKALGIETTFLGQDDEFPTGTVDVSFDAQHNPDYVINPGVAYDYIKMTDSLAQIAERAECTCFGTLAQRSDTSRQTLKQLLEKSVNSLKFLDINLRKLCYSPETITFSLQNADVLKLNEEEALKLSGLMNVPHPSIPHFCEEMIEKWALKYCLVTCAEKGAFAMSEFGERVYAVGYKIKLVDSLGAGDAFSAGFVYKILREKPLTEACNFGNILGALTASKAGATAPIQQQEMNEFMNKKQERVIFPELEKFAIT